MKHKFNLMLFIFCVFSLKTKAFNENLYFNHLSVDNRLPGANIHRVFQDNKGLIWLAIESEGLCKYDGNGFKVYKHDEKDTNSISGNFPLCIVEDLAGMLWIGTTNGLNKYDRSTGVFTRFTCAPNGINCVPDNYITDLHVDKFNNIWIATHKGLSKYLQKQDKFCNILTGEGPYTDSLPAIISAIYEDPAGNIWIGSYSSGLFLIDLNENQKHNSGHPALKITKHWFPHIKGLKHENNYAVQQICNFDNNTLLLGKIDGLYLFNTLTGEFSRYFVNPAPYLNYSTVSSLHKDVNDRIWVGYATKGVVLLDKKNNKQVYFNADNYREGGIKSNTIRDIYEDRTGLIWIATKFKGIHTYDNRQEQFTKHLYNDILNHAIGNKFVLSIFEDSDRNIWIGTKNNGLYMFNPFVNRITNYSSKNISGDYYISNNRVECIMEDNNGSIWAGTMNGVHRLNKGDNNFQPLNHYFTRCLTADNKGNIWIGTNSSGIFFYNRGKNKITRYPSKKETRFFNDSTLHTRFISITSDSILWISTYHNGLFKYNTLKDEITLFSTSQTDSTHLTGNIINEIYRDRNGKIWAGTVSSGIYMYDANKNYFTPFKLENEYIPNTIYNIIQDKNGVFWMGSHEGIFMCNPVTGKTSLFNSKYGLNSILSELNARCLTRDNMIFFGGSDGLNVFNPEKIKEKKINAPLIITSVKIYDEIIAEDIDSFTKVTVNYDDKFISIEFALTDYADPHKVQYKYMLEQFDKSWIESGNNYKATYTALPTGKYLFKVLALNKETRPLTFQLIVKGPFWHNPYFIVICIILLIALGIFSHFTRLRIIKLREIKLNELVKEKTISLMELNQYLEENKSKLEEAIIKAEESDKLKTAFLANLSHEIRTPMNGILGFAELLKNQKDTSQHQNYINVIQKSGERMLRIIHDLIDISKIESQQIKLALEKINIESIIDEIYDLFLPMTKSKNIDLFKEININSTKEYVTGDKTRIAQILTNLVNNAVKYTFKGKITMGVKKIENDLLIFVRDTGKGIPADQLNIIFERFRQIEDLETNYTEGSGLGLSISKALVEMHGGKIWVESNIVEGSTFYFTLPIHSIINEEAPVTLDNGIEPPVTASFKGKRVLVAEDDEYSYLLLREILMRYELEVDYAGDGLEAIGKVKDNPLYDIILMDIKMPKMNGIKAAKEIKKINKNIPVIFQSAFIKALDLKSDKKNYVDDYLLKPIEQKELVKLLLKFIS